MNIGIIGYGNMGKAVESQSLIRGHKVFVLPPRHPSNHEKFSEVECVIDFSHADIALAAITECLKAGKHVVSGTTGWNDQLQAVKIICADLNGTLCWAPNFSIGMNITFYLNEVMARIMNQFDDYTPHLLEIHHTEKKDSPSGTAIAMAEQVVACVDRLDTWELMSGNEQDSSALIIETRREKDVKGIHRIAYKSEQDTISLRHHALSRDGFALGAVRTAEWLQGKIGYFTFEDVLDFNTSS